jgi:hypothetical protein
MKALFVIYKTEFIKLKNSFAFWLVILGAAFIPVFFVSNILYKWQDYLHDLVEYNPNPWNEYSRKFFNGEHFTFLPLLIVLLIALVFNIEHQSNSWKHVFVLPVSKSKIFIGKYLIALTLLILFYCLMIVLYLLGGLLLSIWKPAFGFLNYHPSYQYGPVQTNIVIYIIKSFISILAILAIHFWLSFRLKNLFITIGIGIGGVVLATSMYIAHWNSLIYVPYGFPILMCNYISNHHLLSDFHINSIICFIIVSIVSYLDFVFFFKG